MSLDQGIWDGTGTPAPTWDGPADHPWPRNLARVATDTSHTLWAQSRLARSLSPDRHPADGQRMLRVEKAATGGPYIWDNMNPAAPSQRLGWDPIGDMQANDFAWSFEIRANAVGGGTAQADARRNNSTGRVVSKTTVADEFVRVDQPRASGPFSAATDLWTYAFTPAEDAVGTTYDLARFAVYAYTFGEAFDLAAVPWFPNPADWYAPGMFWDVTGVGTLPDGQTVKAGDRVWAIVDASSSYALVDDVRWAVEDITLQDPTKPWTYRPNPIGGCMVTDDTMVIVDMFRPGTVSRTFGEETYGGELYGDVGDVSYWELVTERCQGIVITRGATNGTLDIPVDQVQLDFVDLDGDIIDLAPDSNSASVGTIIRVSLSNGDGSPADVIFVGRVARMVNSHDEFVRRLAVTAFGTLSDLVNSTASIAPRASETQNARISALLASAGWWWEPSTPALPDVTLSPIVEAIEAPNYRAEIDVATWSGRGVMDAERGGALRWRPWPYTYGTPEFTVSDCKGAADVISPRILIVADDEETMNVVVASNVTDDEVERTDPPSIADYGRQSEGLGFPRTGLYCDAATLGQIADAVIGQYRRIVNRVESVDADTGTDPGWESLLRTLDTGQSVLVRRDGVFPTQWETIVCGYTLRILPGRLTATIDLTTVTPTEYIPPA